MKQLRGRDVKKYFKHHPGRNKEIVLVLENIQYARNVANLFRTAESAGVSKIILTGISKQPPFGNDLVKVSRGAEKKVPHVYCNDTVEYLQEINKQGFIIIAIELTDESILVEQLKDRLYKLDKVCFIVGNEDSGVNRRTLELCDLAVMVPMYGKNASLNVTVSAGVILFSF